MMGRRLLLFGRTGKMGSALSAVFADACEVTGLNSGDLDVGDLAAVRGAVERAAPDVVINAAARLGIDACERDPVDAFRINALFPRLLALLSAEKGFILVHFSSETVFSGEKGDYLSEADAPDPINVYGCSKFAGDLAVREAAERSYVFRLPVLFGHGTKRNQFLERMIDRARQAERRLRVADDIVTTPTYAPDAAARVREALETGRPFGLYHLANSERGSLFDLVAATLGVLEPEVVVERASFRDFPGLGRKNTVTPLRSDRLPPLRSWRAAVADYCTAEKRREAVGAGSAEKGH
jgi:dTDP-4-dehydrorhamnose reductase